MNTDIPMDSLNENCEIIQNTNWETTDTKQDDNIETTTTVTPSSLKDKIIRAVARSKIIRSYKFVILIDCTEEEATEHRIKTNDYVYDNYNHHSIDTLDFYDPSTEEKLGYIYPTDETYKFIDIQTNFRGFWYKPNNIDIFNESYSEFSKYDEIKNLSIEANLQSITKLDFNNVQVNFLVMETIEDLKKKH